VLQARVAVAVQLVSGEVVVFGIHGAEPCREASAAITKFLPPIQGLGILESPYYPGRRSPTRFALGYYLSGLRPFQFEPCYLGCYGCNSR
jgi:hypothetical protein